MFLKTKLQTAWTGFGLTSFGIIPTASMVNLGYHSDPVLDWTIVENPNHKLFTKEIDEKLNSWRKNKTEIMELYKGKTWTAKLIQQGDWFGRQTRMSIKYKMPEENHQKWTKRINFMRDKEPADLLEKIKDKNDLIKMCARITLRKPTLNYKFIRKYCWMKA